MSISTGYRSRRGMSWRLAVSPEAEGDNGAGVAEHGVPDIGLQLVQVLVFEDQADVKFRERM